MRGGSWARLEYADRSSHYPLHPDGRLGVRAGGPNSLIMSCASSRALVQKRGAVLMYTGPGIFDRYVANQSFCAGNEMTKPAWIATVDQPQCLVGSVCREIEMKTR